MDRSVADSRFGISGKLAGQATNHLPEGLYETLERNPRRRKAPQILLMIQPVFDLPFAAGKYDLVVYIHDLPLIRFDVLN
jgi:hypothetical protein